DGEPVSGPFGPVVGEYHPTAVRVMPDEQAILGSAVIVYEERVLAREPVVRHDAEYAPVVGEPGFPDRIHRHADEIEPERVIRGPPPSIMDRGSSVDDRAGVGQRDGEL